MYLWIEPWHEISNNVVCAASKGSDQPAHTCSLIRAFVGHLNILWLLSYWPNIILRFKIKRRLHRLFWVCTCQNATLLETTCRGSIIQFPIKLKRNVSMWNWLESDKMSLTIWLAVQQRLSSAWAIAQVDPSLCCMINWQLKAPSFFMCPVTGWMPEPLLVIAGLKIKLLILPFYFFHEVAHNIWINLCMLLKNN